jgi:hypothetical protein
LHGRAVIGISFETWYDSSGEPTTHGDDGRQFALVQGTFGLSQPEATSEQDDDGLSQREKLGFVSACDFVGAMV